MGSSSLSSDLISQRPLSSYSPSQFKLGVRELMLRSARMSDFNLAGLQMDSKATFSGQF